MYLTLKLFLIMFRMAIHNLYFSVFLLIIFFSPHMNDNSLRCDYFSFFTATFLFPVILLLDFPNECFS